MNTDTQEIDEALVHLRVVQSNLKRRWSAYRQPEHAHAFRCATRALDRLNRSIAALEVMKDDLAEEKAE